MIVVALTPRRRRGVAVAALAGVAVAILGTAPAQAAVPDKINFQPAGVSAPSGYRIDSGLGYDATRGYGWVSPTTSTPVDLSAGARDRGTPADRRLATLVHMQRRDATTTYAGRWEYAVPNGTYAVTAAVGDGGKKTDGTYCCLDSVHRLTVEGVLAVNNFTPTATTPFFTTTVTIAVSDGRLTIDPAGGVNTKINYVDIAASSGTPTPPSPQVAGVTPAPGATQVPVNTSVNLDVNTPIDPATMTSSTFLLSGPSGQVTGTYNSDASGGTAAFTPSANLEVNTTYTVNVTTGLKSVAGESFAPFSSTFKTGSSPPPLSPFAFRRIATTPLAKPGVMVIGPDNLLYAATSAGSIVRYPRAADGTLGTPQSVTPFGDRIILGLAFDPLDSTRLFVSNNAPQYNDAPRFSGRISTITIPAGVALSATAASARDVIIGLPRSEHDHMTNGIAFGPDGKLYIAQGANTAYGAPDPYWGTRGESPLSAAVLVADVNNAAAFPADASVNVNTDPVGTVEDAGSASAVGYDAAAAGAPVRAFATGVRNAFSLTWGTNGNLYAPVNESAAGGNTPAGPGNVPPAALNVQTYADYFSRVDSGRYYGHPNPSIGYYALNGANPTDLGDPSEVTEYPVGVQPDANWRQPDLLVGLHRSVNGSAQFGSVTAFDGALKGQMLLTEFSSGDDLLAVSLDGAGRAVSAAVIPDAAAPTQSLSFNNPLGIVTDPASGVVYVTEYGPDSDYTAGGIAVLQPGSTAPPPEVTTPIKVNFQPATAPVPTGYKADVGSAFTGQSGWKDLAGAALDLTANTRDRNSALSPDQRYDTIIHMQAPAGSGTTTPGQWVYALPNGDYDVTVGVGDATSYNSVNTLTAEYGTTNAAVLVDGFVPTSAAPFATATKRVSISDGYLNLDPRGGSNTKLDFVEIAAVTTGADRVAPQVAVETSGTLRSSATYSGDVRVSVTASDNVGVTSTTYTLDGGPSQTYTAPFTVSADGSHTVVATAKDAAGNTGSATTTFAIDTSVPPAPTQAHVNFQPQTAPVPTGYTVDYGQAFDAARGSGWSKPSDGTPLSLEGNARDRNGTASPDQRYDTLMHMQLASAQYGGVAEPGRWEQVLANGTYNVTVGVGDPSATNSIHKITAEPATVNATVLVDSFVPTTTTLWQTVTKEVTVSDGRLTLDPTGGTNTKIDFVDVVPVVTPPGDSTAPTATVNLSGPSSSPDVFTGDVQVTITAADEQGGSGLKSVTYTLDGGPSTAYVSPFTVTSDGDHTLVVKATDTAGNVGSTTKTWSESHPPTGTPKLTVTSSDDALLGSVTPTLVFSTFNRQATPARAVTFTNSGTGTLTVSGLAIGGTASSSYALVTGQPTSLSLGAGQSASVQVLFTPTAATNCPTSTGTSIGDVERYATLTFTSNDTTSTGAVVKLNGLNACNVEGNSEPVFSQIVRALGYTTKVASTTADSRFLGPLRSVPASDEIQVPYWSAVDPSKPVTMTPVAHYSGRNTSKGGFGRTGWHLKAAPVKTSCTAVDGCQQLNLFPADTSTAYVENQKLLPKVTGVTSFTPSGSFGLWHGDYTDINFSDDGKNHALTTSATTITPPHYLHDLRAYPALGPNRVRIPDTWIVGVDITRVPAYKNNDYQDTVFVLRNVKPEIGSAAQPGAALTRNLTTGGTVSSSCVVTGFDGVMANTAGTQCNSSNIAFNANGLNLTSTAGQMGGSSNNQQNALYNEFDSSKSPFTVTARVKGPVNYLASNYQQVAAFFGPDQDNYVKVEAEHNTTGSTGNLTMFFEEKGVGATVATVPLPALSTASTVDLIIKGNTSVPDPTPAASDPNVIRNYPLGRVAVYYSIDGGTPVQVGTIKSPTDVTRWFSTTSRAGLLVSGGGATSPFTATFTSFSIAVGTTTVG